MFHGVFIYLCVLKVSGAEKRWIPCARFGPSSVNSLDYGLDPFPLRISGAL